MMVLLLACTNKMSATSDAPFKLGSLKKALFAESRWSSPDTGSGNATLLLVDDASYSCSDLQSELSGDTDARDSITWSASGAVVDIDWWNNLGTNIGWEGDYYQGSYSYSGYYYYDYAEEDDGDQKGVSRRQISSVAFADGQTFQGSYLFGHLEIASGDADAVTGRIDTEWWKAKFKAENCGQVGEDGPSESDTDADDEEDRDTG